MRKAVHLSNLAQTIGFLESVQETMREQPFMLSREAAYGLANRLDHYLKQLRDLQEDLMVEVTAE